MIKPPYLKKGDKIAIVCTARKFSKEEAQPAIQLMESWGLQVVLGETIGKDNFQLGGTDEDRVNDFNKQLANPEIKAIWCARGGYGTVRIIDQIDFGLLTKSPKWIIGFSDVTVLHSHIHKLGIETIHGIMAFSVPKATEKAKDTLYHALFNGRLEYKIKSCELNKYGNAQGELVGGNLSILYSLLGSPSAIDTNDKILFIEDLDEYLYHLDRMMYNLKRNGVLDNLRGMIVGGMTDMHDNEIPFGQKAHEIILSAVSDKIYPVVFDFPSGHGAENNALILGRKIVLETNPQESVLKFEEHGRAL
ncbi:S66 peptidase family protein [Myroides indicus]|nr:LD-carboxypeptidase [Myroides indicus]